MTSPESISGPLQDMASAFEGCVVWAAKAILETEVKLKAPFEVLSSVPEGSLMYCILPAASARYYAQLVVGIEDGDLPDLFPREPDEKVRKDAIGEIANVISGLFIADDQFIATFGYLKPSTPFFSEGAFTARKDWGLKGRIEANGREISLQFSIRDLQDPAALAADKSNGDAMNREGSPG
jgi:hypothetical protein